MKATEWIKWNPPLTNENENYSKRILPPSVTPETMVRVKIDGIEIHEYRKADDIFFGHTDHAHQVSHYKIANMVPDDAPTANKYSREIKTGCYVDVYDVLKAFDVKCPALQHLIKKALAAGNRGHKDLLTDLDDIIDSAIRAKELAQDDS